MINGSTRYKILQWWSKLYTEDTCYQYISTRINNVPQYCAFVHLQIFKQYQYMTLKLQAKQTKITVAIHVLIFFSNFCSMRVRLIVKSLSIISTVKDILIIFLKIFNSSLLVISCGAANKCFKMSASQHV